MDLEKFTKKVVAILEPKSTGYCARHIRIGLEYAGAVVIPRPASAKDYGKVLLKNGFAVLPNKIDDYKAESGDVVVWNAHNTSKHGHIQVYAEGWGWLSDFKQNSILPNQKHANLWLSGGYTIYRYYK